MKIRLMAEVEYATTSIHEVDENGDISKYRYGMGDEYRTGESWYRLETSEGDYIESIDRSEFDYETVADYIKHLERLEGVGQLDIHKWVDTKN